MVAWFLLSFMSVLGKEQIGHVPIKGNLWRAKFANEIVRNVSQEFATFMKNAKNSSSEETGIIYYFSDYPYPYADIDDTMCVYSLDRNLPKDTLSGSAVSFANFTLYFACDDVCCAMECCQRDIQMTIIGTGLIGISLLILLFYAFIYLSGLVCAWRNGSIGRRQNMDHSFTIIKNNHT